MMAARAGADEVITCEAYADVAGAARAVIARNGFQDRVKVVDKTSTQLKLGVDMSGPADVLVWDNLSNDMLGSGALPAVEDAMRRLVRPGGAVIPAGCAVRAALAEDRGLHRRVMGFVEGFDLSPFNILAKPGCTVDVGSGEVSLRSEAVTLFDFDLKSGGPFPAQRASAEVAGEGGRANGLLQWLDFRLDDEERYVTVPGGASRAFGPEFHPVAAGFEAASDETFVIGASHDRQKVRIWLEGSRGRLAWRGAERTQVI